MNDNENENTEPAPIATARQRKITTQIVLMVAIPMLLLSGLAGWELYMNFNKLVKASLLTEDIAGTKHLSKLIGTLQVERGISVVYIKSSRKLAMEKVQGKRSAADDLRPAATAFLESSADRLPGAAPALESLSKLEAIRERLATDLTVPDVVGFYTKLITQLLRVTHEVGQTATGAIGTRITSVELLETARENAGLLRANLSGILSADLPISDALFLRILRFKAGIDANLNFKGLEVSADTREKIRSFEETAHWKEVNRVFQTVITLAAEGGFDEDAEQFFATISKVVNDIRDTIFFEIDDTTLEAGNAITELRTEIVTLSVGLCVTWGLLILYVLHGLVKIKKSFRTIIGELVDMVSHLRQTAYSINSSSQDLQVSVTEQASSLEETSSSVEQISSMTGNNVEQAERSDDSSREVSKLAGEGTGHMQQLLGSMSDLEESNKKIQGLAHIMEVINEKTSIIDDIVFQTKLLSFNASVEAERAGESGRGFAVVAQEVGNLARMSGDAAIEITRLVKDSMNEVRTIAGENTEKVERSSHAAQQAATFLEQIEQLSTNVAEQSSQIVASSREQSSGIDLINHALQNMEQLSSKNQQIAQQTLDSGENLSDQSEHLNETVIRISRLMGAEAALAEEAQEDNETDHQEAA